MELLGYKSLKYIVLYDQLSHIYVNNGNREYVCKEAFTHQQEIQFIEQRFEYVRTDKDDVSLLRKLKDSSTVLSRRQYPIPEKSMYVRS
jgi:hypothetical protein